MIEQGGRIDVSGFRKDFYDVGLFGRAGRIGLTATTGSVRLHAGGELNFAAHRDGGDAGRLDVAALGGTFAGTISGHAAAGATSGSFALDASAASNFGALNEALNASGVLEARTFRVRNGDIVLDGMTRARELIVQADRGSVTVTGTLDASSDRGGRIEIAAARNLTIRPGAALLASNTGEFGSSRVFLETRGEGGGVIDVQGAVIDVTSPDGGRVVFRAPQTRGGAIVTGADVATEVAVGTVNAAILGARETMIEGYRVYEGATTSSVMSQAVAQANAFAALGLQRNGIAVAPGIEIRSSSDLTHDASWNLSGDFPAARLGGLTLRAAGNLVMTANLSDGFTAADLTGALHTGASWNLRLIAGADLDAASVLGVVPRELIGNSGSLTVGTSGAPVVIRTGTGDIDVLAANRITLGDTASVIYSAGMLDTSSLGGFTPRADAYYARYGGDVRISAGSDIVAVPSEQLVTEWLWRWGMLDEATFAFFNPGEQPTWWVQHDRFKQGVGALGGGDVTVRAGGAISNLSVVQPTMGRVAGGRTAGETRVEVIHNGGLMNVTAGGAIRGGLFYAGRGEAHLSAATFDIGRTVYYDNWGTVTPYQIAPILALGDTRMTLTSAGNMTIQTVLEPLMARIDSDNLGSDYRRPQWLTYKDRTALSLTSSGGNIQLVNQTLFLFDQVGYENLPRSGAGALYPSKLALAALNGSVQSLGGVQGGLGAGLVMTPGLTSELLMAAEQDVSFVEISQARLPFSLMPSPVLPIRIDDMKAYFRNELTGSFNLFPQSPEFIYVSSRRNPEVLDLASDDSPVRIYARSGSIEHPYARAGSSRNPNEPRQAIFFSNEMVWLRAGRDIRAFDLQIRNNRVTDVSLLEAGNDILMTSGAGQSLGNIVVRGPGAIVLQAGRDVYFENAQIGQGAISSVGNVYTYYDGTLLEERGLAAGGADIAILAGIRQRPDYEGFAAKYLDPANMDQMPDYLVRTGGPLMQKAPIHFFELDDDRKMRQNGLISFVVRMTGQASYEKATAQEVWQAFRALPALTQELFLRRVMTYELRETNAANAGMALSDQDHTRGYKAIASLFPGQIWKGSIVSTSSRIETTRGGDIDMFVPGGGLQVAALSAVVPNGAGIMTSSYGDIRLFSQGNVTVNRSRVLTFEGGDMIIGTPYGDIDAGRGAKTSRSGQSPEVLIDDDGFTTIREKADRSGSGIGTVEGFADVPPGDLHLWAPAGVVNAGDAGIRVTGNLAIAALQVVGVANIDVKGDSKGVPKMSALPPPQMEPVKDKSASDAAKDAAERGGAQGQPSVIIVEVLGYGGGEGERSVPSEEELRRWQLDMPPQPVDEAIYRLGVVTGVQIFADGSAVAGRKSKAISGDYTAAEALRRLLAGTGLVARAAGPGAMMVALGLAGPEGEAVRQTYSIALQRAALAALCRHGGAHLGQYRLALRMWIAEQGYPERIELLSSTGDEERDSLVRRALLAMTAERPPAELPQPVVMVLLPRSHQDSGDCNASDMRASGHR